MTRDGSYSKGSSKTTETAGAIDYTAIRIQRRFQDVDRQFIRKKNANQPLDKTPQFIVHNIQLM